MINLQDKIVQLQNIVKNPTLTKTKGEYDDALVLLSWLTELADYREEYAKNIGYEEDQEEIRHLFPEEEDWDEDDEDWDVEEETENQETPYSRLVGRANVINSILYNESLTEEGIAVLQLCDESFEEFETIIQILNMIQDLKETHKHWNEDEVDESLI